MTDYPLLSRYPIRTCINMPFPPGSSDCIEWLNINDANMHLNHVIEFGNDNGLRCELFNNYSSILSTFELIKDIGNRAHSDSTLYTFRHTPNKVNPWSVTLKINRLGLYLSEGQILFHGGDFKHLCHRVGDDYVTEIPLCTTLCPEIAVYFSDKHMQEHLGEIQIISVSAQAKTRAIALTHEPDLAMKHEMEVLLEAGAKLTFKGESYVNGVGQRRYRVSHYCLK
ncbi:hypothetical protein ACRRGR_003256 [Vibrio alginolyticus]